MQKKKRFYDSNYTLGQESDFRGRKFNQKKIKH